VRRDQDDGPRFRGDLIFQVIKIDRPFPIFTPTPCGLTLAPAWRLLEAAHAGEGSVARTLTLLGGDQLKLQQRTTALLAALPQVDPRELHALGEQLPLSDRVALAAFVDGVERWSSERLRTDNNANANLPRLARLAEVWEKIARAARDTADYNLERKPFVFSVFSLLADATR
jgi:DNA polymerase-3 subunit delta'